MQVVIVEETIDEDNYIIFNKHNLPDNILIDLK